MRKMQEHSNDQKAQREALIMKRAQEESEREWRKRQHAEAWKKTHTEEVLNQARIKQEEEKERLLSVEVQRDRVDFERMLK